MRRVVFALTTILVIIFLMEPMAESVYAQSTKPSAPKFSIQLPNNNTIQIVIQNQAFTSSSAVNSLVYYYKVKDHYSNTWKIVTTITFSMAPKLHLPIGLKCHSAPIVIIPMLNNSTLWIFNFKH